MSANTEQIFISLKSNGFEISLLEVEKMLNKLVEEGFIHREMPSMLEKNPLHIRGAHYRQRDSVVLILR